MAVADVNGDGKPDLWWRTRVSAAITVNGTVGVLLGNGDGTFQTAVTYGSGGLTTGRCGSWRCAVADVNGDGKPDLSWRTRVLAEITVPTGRWACCWAMATEPSRRP